MAIVVKELFVIKNKHAYMFLHQDKEDLSSQFTNLDNAMKFTKEELNYIYKKFKERWERDKYEVYRLKFVEERTFAWLL